MNSKTESNQSPGMDYQPEKQEEVIYQILKEIGVGPEAATLLQAALTHRSWSNEAGRLTADSSTAQANERLEFLGDSVLGLIMARKLYDLFPQADEGRLSKAKGRLVSAGLLSKYAQTLGLGQVLRLGHGEELSGGRQRESLLANAMEAVIGAVFIIAGWEKVEDFVLNQWQSEIKQLSIKGIVEDDPKSQLQEICQKRFGELPVYRLKQMTGPEHNRCFEIEVLIQGQIYGQGQGSSKKQAAQMAAAEVLQRIQQQN